jgi:hypothetical protein
MREHILPLVRQHELRPAGIPYRCNIYRKQFSHGPTSHHQSSGKYNPFVTPYKDPGNTGSVNSSFALFPVGDIPEGEMEILYGIRNGTSYAVEYSIRDARTDAVCYPYCRDEIIHGVLYPAMSGTDATRFAIRFDTTDLEPGPYVADLGLTCSDAKARGWFNVTPVKAGIP